MGDMASRFSLNRQQFINLHHFTDPSNEESIRRDGLLPLNDQNRDEFKDNWHGDTVWAFDSPQGRERPELRVSFRVPYEDAHHDNDGYFGGIYYVKRPIAPREITEIKHHDG